MFNEKTRQTMKYNAICLFLFIPTLNYYLSEITQKVFSLPSFTFVAYILLYLIVGGVLLFFYARYKKFLLAYLVIVLLALVNILLYGNFDYAFSTWYDLPYNRFYKLVFMCLPLFFVAPLIDSYEHFFSIMFYYSLAHMILGPLIFFVYVIKDWSYDYMSLAYNMLFSIAFAFYYSIKNKRSIATVVSVFAAIVVVLSGCRGALICLIIYILTFFFTIHSKKNYRSKFIVLIMLLALSGIVVVNIRFFLGLLINLFEASSFKSRTIQSIIDGTFFVSQGRTSIYTSIYNSILEEPIIGHGLFGDFLIIANTVERYWQIGTYSHNFFLEIFCEFGVIVGIIAVTLFFYLLFVFLSEHLMDVKFDLVVMLLCSEFIKLLFSGSYLASPMFFFMFGIVFWSFFGSKTRCLYNDKNNNKILF